MNRAGLAHPASRRTTVASLASRVNASGSISRPEHERLARPEHERAGLHSALRAVRIARERHGRGRADGPAHAQRLGHRARREPTHEPQRRARVRGLALDVQPCGVGYKGQPQLARRKRRPWAGERRRPPRDRRALRVMVGRHVVQWKAAWPVGATQEDAMCGGWCDTGRE